MPRGQRTMFAIQLNNATRSTLSRWLRSPKITLRLAKRVQAMLLLDQHVPYARTARVTGLSETHVRKWAARYREEGLEGLLDRQRPERLPGMARRPRR